MGARFKRKNIRLPAENYRGERMYFLTLCFNGRRAHGSRSAIAHWLIEALLKSSVERGFLIHAYCLMPDHLHLLVAGTSARSDLLAFVNSYKQETAFAFSQKNGESLWQFKFFDHILRKPGDLESVAWYIWLNPVRKALCKVPQDYPYSGSFTEAGSRLFASFPREGWVPPWRQGEPVPR